MTVRVITGSKQQIAEQVAGLTGEVREAIVFIDDAPRSPTPSGTPGDAGPWRTVDEFFAEMTPYMVDVADDVDDSREAIYDRPEGE
jgi:hypothetical protein